MCKSMDRIYKRIGAEILFLCIFFVIGLNSYPLEKEGHELKSHDTHENHRPIYVRKEYNSHGPVLVAEDTKKQNSADFHQSLLKRYEALSAYMKDIERLCISCDKGGMYDGGYPQGKGQYGKNSWGAMHGGVYPGKYGQQYGKYPWGGTYDGGYPWGKGHYGKNSWGRMHGGGYPGSDKQYEPYPWVRLRKNRGHRTARN